MKYYGLVAGSKVVTDAQGLPRAWERKAQAKEDKGAFERMLGIRLRVSEIQLYPIPFGYRLDVPTMHLKSKTYP